MKKSRYILVGILCLTLLVACFVMTYDSNLYSSTNKIALLGTVALRSADGQEYIKVNACYSEKNQIWMSVEFQLPQRLTTENFDSVFQVSDVRGIVQNLSLHGLYSDLISRKQLAIIAFPVLHFSTQYNLSYNGENLPLILSKVDSDDPRYLIKNFDEIGDVSIAAFPEYDEQFIAQIHILIKSDSYPETTYKLSKDAVQLTDCQGNFYELLCLNDDNILTFDAEFSNNLILNIDKICIGRNENDIVAINGPWCIALKY